MIRFGCMIYRLWQNAKVDFIKNVFNWLGYVLATLVEAQGNNRVILHALFQLLNVLRMVRDQKCSRGMIIKTDVFGWEW